MNILLGIFIFTIGSSLIMVGYVLIRDIKHKRSFRAEIAVTDDQFFEDIKSAEAVLADYDYKQKTA